MIQEAAQQFVGQMTPVSVWEINRKQNKFVGNIIEAMNNRAYSSIAVRPSGVFFPQTTKWFSINCEPQRWYILGYLPTAKVHA